MGFVAAVPEALSEAALLETLSRFGEVSGLFMKKGAILPSERPEGLPDSPPGGDISCSKGYAFCGFASRNEAKSAVSRSDPLMPVLLADDVETFCSLFVTGPCHDQLHLMLAEVSRGETLTENAIFAVPAKVETE